MRERIIVFKRKEGRRDWINAEAALCGTGVADYLDIPKDINEFEAVFTVSEPEGVDVFELYINGGGISIKSEFTLQFVDSSRHLMRLLWNRGYRCIHVRY